MWSGVDCGDTHRYADVIFLFDLQMPSTYPQVRAEPSRSLTRPAEGAAEGAAHTCPDSAARTHAMHLTTCTCRPADAVHVRAGLHAPVRKTRAAHAACVQEPPKVKYLSVLPERLNPNLYEDGKVRSVAL
jgi:hypothetical protein